MTLSLHERRVLTGIERELAKDPRLRALSTFTEPESEEPRAGQADAAENERYLISGDGAIPSRGSRRHRVLVVLAMLVLLAGPVMLVPALLTGITLLALPVLAAPLTALLLLALARRCRG